jgi:hypothetical protein
MVISERLEGVNMEEIWKETWRVEYQPPRDLDAIKRLSQDAHLVNDGELLAL